MVQTLFTAEPAISDDWLTYLENEAAALSQWDEFSIKNYVDRELLNPEVQEFLENTFAESTEENSAEGLALSFQESILLSGKAFLFGKWKSLKKKVQKIFCSIVGAIEKEVKWKDILKSLLVALLPVFSGGIPAIVLPIVVALIAALMKFGYGHVCPA